MPKTVATPELIAFAKANYLTMTAADIDKKFGVSKGVTRRIYEKYGLVVPKSVTYKLRAAKLIKNITPDQDEYIKANIETKAVKQIANELGICANKTRKRCYELGFKDLLAQKTINSRFSKGHAPINKGVRMSEELKARIKHTFFQKGHIPHNTKDDGSISTRMDKRGIPYMYYRVNMSDWIPYHHKIWQDHHGKIPKKMNIIFKNRDTLDCRIENLEMVSNAELMKLNSIHRFPSEFKEQIRKLAKLKRIINKKITKNEQTYL